MITSTETASPENFTLTASPVGSYGNKYGNN